MIFTVIFHIPLATQFVRSMKTNLSVKNVCPNKMNVNCHVCNNGKCHTWDILNVGKCFFGKKSHIVMLFNTCLSYDTVSENLEDLFFREINDYVFKKKNRFIFILLTFYAYFKSSTTNHHITCFENSQKWHWIPFSYCFVLISNEPHYIFCWSVTRESPILVYTMFASHKCLLIFCTKIFWASSFHS